MVLSPESEGVTEKWGYEREINPRFVSGQMYQLPVLQAGIWQPEEKNIYSVLQKTWTKSFWDLETSFPSAYSKVSPSPVPPIFPTEFLLRRETWLEKNCVNNEENVNQLPFSLKSEQKTKNL